MEFQLSLFTTISYDTFFSIDLLSLLQFLLLCILCVLDLFDKEVDSCLQLAGLANGHLKIGDRFLLLSDEALIDKLLIHLLDLVTVDAEARLCPVLDLFEGSKSHTWGFCAFYVKLHELEFQRRVTICHLH